MPTPKRKQDKDDPAADPSPAGSASAKASAKAQKPKAASGPTRAKPARKPTKPKSPRRPKPKSSSPQPRKPKAGKPAVDPATVHLTAGRGSSDRGGGPGGHYWHIYTAETRAGYVYINVIEEAPFGRHASIQIHVNQTHRGRGVGRVAYRLACEQSGHDTIIAHMRKNNLASQRAAAAAGFVVVADPAITQLAMRWTRPVASTASNAS